MTGWLLAFWKALETPAVDEEDIHPVVLIVVEEGGTAPGGFEEIFVAVFAAEYRFRMEAGL
jgi:hypothetical protein